ncbi:MAG: hemolysin III family protein [Bacteriovoracaceae bacterium]|nr:hemolysin III family protein [Bacteriovoracaceae bacterium]
MKKPLLRGHIHQESFFLALGACAMLVAKATTSMTFIAGLVYSVCLVMLFGISAVYHRPNWSVRKRAIMRRIDHSAIYLLIAGCFTPICLLALSESTGIQLLTIVYVAVTFGIIKSIFWVNAPKLLSALLYTFVGALFIPYISELNEGLGFTNMVLIWSGCIIYVIGGIFYAFKRPNFFPDVFGHHELFHFFTVIGAILHFIVMYRLIS